MQAPSERQARKPYPVPDHLEPNGRRARLLMACYSGRNSEMTAAAQYYYHHIALGGENPSLAKTLRSIAVQETYHMDMLGECIRRLGAQPRFVYHYGNRRTFWNAGFIRYGRTLREMLEADITGEKEGIALYERVIRQIDEPDIARLLNRILEDEQEHLNLLQRVLERG